MVILLAIVGALLIGAVCGLLYRGLVVLGDHRQLSILTEQLQTEQRMRQQTNQALAQMRVVATEHFRQDGPA